MRESENERETYIIMLSTQCDKYLGESMLIKGILIGWKWKETSNARVQQSLRECYIYF